MAWTSPKTWAFGEVLTSTDMNTYVRDNTDDLDTRVGALLAGGIGSNVVQTVKTDTFSTSSTSYTDVTGMNVTITPTSSSSKVLVLVSIATTYTGSDSDFAFFDLLRGSTSLLAPDSPGSRTVSLVSSTRLNLLALYRVDFSFLDSPATDLATTYKVQTRVNGNTMQINRASTDTNNDNSVRSVSTITAIEVAA
jgi:hypothetical protein